MERGEGSDGTGRGTRWNGEGPEETKRDLMEWIGGRWNKEARGGTEGDQMERRGARRNGKGLEETERFEGTERNR